MRPPHLGLKTEAFFTDLIVEVELETATNFDTRRQGPQRASQRRCPGHPTFDLIDIYIFAPNEFQESIKHIYNQDIWGPIYTRNDKARVHAINWLIVGAL